MLPHTPSARSSAQTHASMHTLTHRYSADCSLLMFPCEMSLHDKEEAIRKPLKHYFLSVATVTDLILQLQSLP